MKVNSFQIATVYAKAVLKLGLNVSDFQKLVQEITEVSKHKIEVLSLSKIKQLPLSGETIKILSLLYNQSKLFILKDLAKQLETEFLKKIESALFTVSTVSPITKDEAEKLKMHLRTLFKKEVILEEKLDPSLIGGFTLSFESFLLDFSKKSKISKIKACILNT